MARSGPYNQVMELRQLEAFVALAAELHFGRAAQQLHVGQPTLSELIQRLERELGTPLLTRTTRRVALTGAGSELLGRAKVILDDLAAVSAAVRPSRPETPAPCGWASPLRSPRSSVRTYATSSPPRHPTSCSTSSRCGFPTS
jgi:hypothetical protein